MNANRDSQDHQGRRPKGQRRRKRKRPKPAASHGGDEFSPDDGAEVFGANEACDDPVDDTDREDPAYDGRVDNGWTCDDDAKPDSWANKVDRSSTDYDDDQEEGEEKDFDDDEEPDQGPEQDTAPTKVFKMLGENSDKENARVAAYNAEGDQDNYEEEEDDIDPETFPFQGEEKDKEQLAREQRYIELCSAGREDEYFKEYPDEYSDEKNDEKDEEKDEEEEEEEDDTQGDPIPSDDKGSTGKKPQKKRAPFTYLPATTTEYVKGGAAAVLFARIIYWYGKTADGNPRLKQTVMVDNRQAWLPGYAEIRRQTGLTKDQIQRGLDRLIEEELVVAHHLYKPGKRVLFRMGIQLTKACEEFLREQGYLEHRTKPPGVKGVKVTVPNVRITGTINQAIVLSAVLPWFRRSREGKSKLRVFRDGYKWRSNSITKLSGDTGLSEGQVERALEGLKKRKFIITAHYQSAFEQKKPMRTLHVRPNWAALKAAYKQLK